MAQAWAWAGADTSKQGMAFLDEHNGPTLAALDHYDSAYVCWRHGHDALATVEISPGRYQSAAAT